MLLTHPCPGESDIVTEIHLFDIYRSANIGIFLKANEKFCLVPHGLAVTKRDKISEFLHIETVPSSVAGSRLLGPLTAMNSHGMIVSRLSDDEEARQLGASTGLNVLKLESRFTSVGNLISANDHGAVISDVFSDESTKEVERVSRSPGEKDEDRNIHTSGGNGSGDELRDSCSSCGFRIRDQI